MSASLLPDEQALVVALLLFARFLPLGALALGRSSAVVALGLPAVLTLGLHGAASASAGALPRAGAALGLLCVRELMIGLSYALWLLLPLSALGWAGRLSGRALRAPGAEPSVGGLYGALAAASFFALGGHRVALAALGAHLALEPLGSSVAASSLPAMALESLSLAGSALLLAVTLALPLLAAMGLAELAVALAARGAATPLPLSVLPLAPLLGLLLLLAALPALSQRFARIFAEALRWPF